MISQREEPILFVKAATKQQEVIEYIKNLKVGEPEVIDYKVTLSLFAPDEKVVALRITGIDPDLLLPAAKAIKSRYSTEFDIGFAPTSLFTQPVPKKIDKKHSMLSSTLAIQQQLPQSKCLSAEEKMIQQYKALLLDWDSEPSSRALNNEDIEKIIKNLRDALIIDKIIKVEDLDDVSYSTVRDIFRKESNELSKIALKEKLFTLKEIDPIQTNIIEELLTDKGIQFLRNVKQSDYDFSLIARCHPEAISYGIETGLAGNVCIKDSEIQEKREKEIADIPAAQLVHEKDLLEKQFKA